jgi:VanZ family protein
MLVAFALWACLTSTSVPGTERVNDKFMHVAGYFSLTFWFTGIYPRSRYTTIAGLLFAMGIAVEVLQGLMHIGRTADIRDIAANSIGIAFGITGAIALLGGWMQRVESWLVS